MFRLRKKKTEAWVPAFHFGYMCNAIGIPLSKMVAVEQMPLLLRISWVPGSNLSPDTDHQKLFLKLLSYSKQMLGYNLK